MFVRIAMVLAILLLPMVAEAQQSDCLIPGEIGHIRGKLTYVNDIETLSPIPLHGFVVELAPPRCYARDKNNSTGWADLDGPVDGVQIAIDEDSSTPALKAALGKVHDLAARQEIFYKYLKSIVGRRVDISGYVIASSGRQLTDPTIYVVSMTVCQPSPRSKAAEKC